LDRKSLKLQQSLNFAEVGLFGTALQQSEMKRNKVVKFGLNNGGSDGTGCSENKVKSRRSEVYAYEHSNIK